MPTTPEDDLLRRVLELIQRLRAQVTDLSAQVVHWQGHAERLEADRDRWRTRANRVDEENVSLLLKLNTCVCPGDPVEPVDPPVEPPVEPVDPPVEPPVTGERPGEDLDWNVQPVPTEFHWIVEGGVAVHQATGLAISTGLGDCYRHSRTRGQEGMILFGIRGNGGTAAVGGRYGVRGPDDIALESEDLPSAGFVGLTPDAEIRWSFNFASSKAKECGNVGCWNIGLRGASDSFIVRTDGAKRCKDVTLDGCWYLPDTPGRTYTSGMHISGWDRLVIRNHLWRGRTPGEPGVKFREHSIAYLKDGTVSTLIENCDLFGGNRTGFQKRPQPFNDADGTPKNPLPTDRFMIRNNYGRNLGGNWDPSQSDGGAAITVWVTFGGLFVYDNVVENFRYKALVVTGQPRHEHNPNKLDKNYNEFLASGNQHDRVYVSGNRFIPGPLTERGTVSVDATDYVALYADNVFHGPVTLNSETNHIYNGLRNVTEEILVRAGELPPQWDLRMYDEALGDERPLREDEIAAMTRRY